MRAQCLHLTKDLPATLLDGSLLSAQRLFKRCAFLSSILREARMTMRPLFPLSSVMGALLPCCLAASSI